MEEEKKIAEKQKIYGMEKNKKFRLKKPQIIGIASCFLIILISFILWLVLESFDGKIFAFVAGIAVVIGGLPFFAILIVEGRKEEEKETMFLEFSRDLVESVRSGTSISQSILNIRTKDYGSLNPYIDKLANQMGMGIPVRQALNTFSKEVKNNVISRAITLIQEAERAGGKIETILESVASSVGQIEKLRKERKAAIYNLVVQGYIVFLIFIAIMLVMQFKILPITSDIGLGGTDLSAAGFGSGSLGGGFGGGKGLSPEEMGSSFMYLLIAQGFFAGLVIGKISEGTIKSGLKHSFILVTLALLLSTGANVFLG